MNRITNILTIAIIFLFSSNAFADSPLTSTEFYKAYASVPIIKEAGNCKGILTITLMNYLADPVQPIDIKMALINRLGWNLKGKKNSSLFIRHLQKKGLYSSELVLKDKCTSFELLCIAYLKAMDNYFDVKDALVYSKLAVAKAPTSYTVQLINALILAQTFSYSSWCRIYAVVENIRSDNSLTIDFNTEATGIIFEYINIYKKYCTTSSPI